MFNKMKFGVIVSDRKAEVHEHDIPPIKADEVLIENKACNICTTDYQQWMGLRPHQPTPMAFGHENSGIVVAVGDEVQNVKPGDHVVGNVYKPCMECKNCRRGKNSAYCLYRPNVYEVKDEYGYYGNYGCSEYQIFKSKHVFKVCKDLPFEHAGFCEPLATVLQGVSKLHIEVGNKVLVIGAGTMGFLNAQAARYFGGDIIISEMSDKKLSAVKGLGFTKTINPNENNLMTKLKEYTGDDGLDAIIIAVGVTAAYNQALEMASRGTKFLIFAAGYPNPTWNLEPNPVHYQMYEIIGTYGCSTADYQLASELLSKGLIDPTPLIEDRFPLKDIQRAFEKASTPDTYRVSVII